MNKLSPDVRCLRTLMTDLASLVDVSTPRTVDPARNTDFGFVTSLFLAMQAELLRSVRSLLVEQRFVAANIVGRAMFEGMVLLLWMNQDRAQRPRKWRSWARVLDWRTLQMRDREGIPTDDAQRARILDGIRRSGHLFLRKSLTGDDPYVTKWTPPLSEMAESIGLYPLYDSVYRLDSQWMHWTPGGVGQTLFSDGETLRHDFAREPFEVGAMNSAFHAAFHSFHNAARWFDLGVAPALFEPLAARFVACYEGTIESERMQRRRRGRENVADDRPDPSTMDNKER